MLVLALDTTTRGGSCAVARDGALLLEQATDPDRPHDAQLPAALMRLLEQAGVTLRDVDLHAVATGPGSFTGLRVGIASMQGLAFAEGKPLVGVSAFDALARIANQTLVATWIDAWRGEVYAALYENGHEIEPPTVEKPEAILARHVRKHVPYPDQWTFIGEGVATYRQAIGSAMGERARIAEPTAPLLAGTIAILATEIMRAGHAPPPHAIRPLYVRRPDAELARAAPGGAGGGNSARPVP